MMERDDRWGAGTFRGHTPDDDGVSTDEWPPSGISSMRLPAIAIAIMASIGIKIRE